MSGQRAPVVIVGSGIAGLSTALSIDDREVMIISAGDPTQDGSSCWAQGGLAAALGPGDSPQLHALDTLKASQGLADAARARMLAEGSPHAIQWLIRQGVAFDRRLGQLDLAIEAAHSRPRIVHAGGDASGARLMAGLLRRARAAGNIDWRGHRTATEIAVHNDRVVGLWMQQDDGELEFLACHDLVLATGGCGALWKRSTNPDSVYGSGLAMALDIGARTRHLEFLQFHPTALDIPGVHARLPLVTEALRGAGAVLLDDRGHRFMRRHHRDAELAPRNVVALAIAEQQRYGNRVFLDASDCLGERFPERFPSVFSACRDNAIDPRLEPIPATPAAHYHMGGLQVDDRGRTSVAGLWACGEVASTGVHGANRLASNSLVEGVVFGRRLAEAVANARQSTWVTECAPRNHWPVPAESDTRMAVRGVMWESAGLARDSASLSRGQSELRDRINADGHTFEAWASLTTALAILDASQARKHSVGAHFRSDSPQQRTA